MNRLQGVGRNTRSSPQTQGGGQRAENQSRESCQIMGIGKASPHGPTKPPWDLSIARGKMGLGDPGSYSFVKSTGQQDTEPGFGFAPPVMGNQGLGQANALGATKTGAPGQWAGPTVSTGIIGFRPLSTGNGQSGLWSSYCIGRNGNWRSGSMG